MLLWKIRQEFFLTLPQLQPSSKMTKSTRVVFFGTWLAPSCTWHRTFCLK